MTSDENGAKQRNLERPRKTVYSVPRRYDLATLFAVSLAYALLFGLIRALGGTPVAFAVVAGFVTFVGLSQAILFRGESPRAASVLAGTVCFALPLLVGIFLRVQFDVWSFLGTICSAFGGALLGYVVGVLIGGVFLVAHGLRQALRRMRDS